MVQRQTPWVIGNWKMNLDAEAATALTLGIVEQAPQLTAVRLALAPPFPYLERVMALLQGTDIRLAAQDIHPEPSGAFTGSVSGAMLADVGARLVLVGHSERRQQCAESDRVVALKTAAALQAGLVPVVCVGESLEEREGGLALPTVLRQLQAVLDVEAWEASPDLLVAYEPVWAIGTGKVAYPEQIAEVHAAMRQKLPPAASILYGGSVNQRNAEKLMDEAEIQGLLIGSASLSADSFTAIARAAAPS